MYSSVNFKTKKEFREAVESGQKITVYQPNNIFNIEPPMNGRVCVEGPHYPQPHKWYAEVTLKDGYVVKVK